VYSYAKYPSEEFPSEEFTTQIPTFTWLSILIFQEVWDHFYMSCCFVKIKIDRNDGTVSIDYTTS